MNLRCMLTQNIVDITAALVQWLFKHCMYTSLKQQHKWLKPFLLQLDTPYIKHKGSHKTVTFDS